MRSTSSVSFAVMAPLSRCRRSVARPAQARRRGRGRLDGRLPPSGRRGPPWCNGSTTAFGAVRPRFESWRRSMTDNTIDDRLAVIVLAAGQGTRMKSSLPKVLHRIGGRPLVGHVLDTALRPRAASASSSSSGTSATWSSRPSADAAPEVRRRRPGRGPGHRPRGRGGPRRARRTSTGDVLVLSGDVPLLEADTLAGLVRAHRDGAAAATVLSATLDDATGYGRVIRDADGAVSRASSSRRTRPRTRHPSPRSTRASTSSRRRRCARTSRSSAPRTRRARST